MVEGEFRFDKRIIDWVLQNDALSRQEYQRHLKGLKDLSEQAAACEARLVRIRKKLPSRSLGEEEEL